MRKVISGWLIVCLISLIFFEANVDAAATHVKTSIHYYHGQQYMQISGENKKVVSKINKILKAHAIISATWNMEYKKSSENASFRSKASTKFNKSGKLSIVYNDRLTQEGNQLTFSTTYNFDLETGERLWLDDVIETESKMLNLVEAVKAQLVERESKGDPIFTDMIHFYLTQSNPSFYYYDHGIVIRFDPDEVAPLSEGYVDVKVAYTTINKKRNDLTSPTPSIPGNDYVTKSHIENEFTGYDYGNIYELANGQMWKQVEYTFYFNYASSPEAIIYQKGSKYYLQAEYIDSAVEVELVGTH
ncbi:RsiV family protein [Paenibacillus sp. 843]|uniref:RsiV family protein n=1 Tax=Paenibacillus sp. 843 TaxID=3341795 RepID=UPI00372777D0